MPASRIDAPGDAPPRVGERELPGVGRAYVALFLGAFVTFASLYSAQPLLPTFSDVFGVSPATASLSLSAATATMTVGLLVSGALSDALGRKRTMAASLFASAVLTLLVAASPDFTFLLVTRGIQGLAVAGLPAIAMSYLSEEMDPRTFGTAAGVYISGNALGGMSGRLLSGVLTDLSSWRVAMAAIGLTSLICAAVFSLLLPPSRNFTPRPMRLSPARVLAPLGRHLLDRGLLSLYGISFLLMGSFVTLYNLIGFELMRPPYGLSQAAVSSIFVVYLAGSFSSAWMGRLADRHGHHRVLWVAVALMALAAITTLLPGLAAKGVGIAAFTFGFFGAHSVASSWVVRRARGDRASASALYLLFFYVGASVAGPVGGWSWSAAGWPGVVGLIVTALALAVALAVLLARVPLPRAPEP